MKKVKIKRNPSDEFKLEHLIVPMSLLALGYFFYRSWSSKNALIPKPFENPVISVAGTRG